jgi:hypothetical protein
LAMEENKTITRITMNKPYYLFLLLAYFVWLSPANAQKEYYVYSDKFDHGAPSGIMGAANGSSLQIDPFNSENPYKGEYALRIEASGEEAWSGLFVQSGGTWREGIDDATPLSDLSGKKYLVFAARSDKDYTVPKIGMGEGKESKKEEAGVPLTKNWQRFVFELPSADDFSRVNGLFLVVFENKGVVYLDEIYYAGAEFIPAASDIVYQERKEPLDPTSFYVFADKFENGVPSGYMGDKNGSSITFDDNWRVNPYQGTKCIKITTDKSETWRGMYILYSGMWNATVNEDTKLADLSQYDKLEFYARADVKASDPYLINEVGVGAGDKIEDKRSEAFVEVGPNWKKYTINLKGMNLKTVNSLIFFVLPTGTLYVDEIRFIRKKEKK